MDMMKMLKEAYQMKSKFKEMQDALKKKSYTYAHGGVTVTIDGTLALTELHIAPELAGDTRRLEEAVTQCIQQAHRKMRDEIAREFQSVQGFPIQ